ncbi:MAG: DUF4065 domain-containing protein [Desulfobacteraceae bacterium]|nr:DUF4065 domain-containing protein [Desulfobacteraceae bacterium]
MIKTTDLFRIGLKYKLKEHKLTQKELAIKIGFMPNHISQYLTMAINFSENKRDIIADFFNLTSLEMMNLGEKLHQQGGSVDNIVHVAKFHNPVKKGKVLERKENKLYTILNIISYIAQELINAKCDTTFHKILKIIYFADQDHLVRYENPVTFDKYFAMDHGPVASETYNLLKMIKGEDTWFFKDEFLDFITVKDNHYVYPLIKADLSVLRKTAKACIDNSIKIHKSMRFKELRDKSHDAAYLKTMTEKENNGDIMKMSAIPYHEIAKAGGADEATVEYIKKTFI